MLIAFPVFARAAEQWVKLTTPHFELYTTAGEKKGREAILYFEQVRSFFLEASPAKRVPDLPVRIVAFRSEGQYKPYRLSESAFAYYAPTRNRDYIVMQDISGDHYPAAIHEYTHLIVQHAGLKLPVWLNEGWADLYSSLEPKGNKALIGSLLPGRVPTLLTTKWLDLPVLTSVDQSSPMYNERNKAGIFYAESWLLVHMLYLSPQYSPNFTKFVLAVANGKNSEQAFQEVYGKSLKQVGEDLHGYINGGRFYGALFAVTLEKSAEDPEVSEPTGFDSGLVLADLLAVVRKKEEARQAYEELLKNYPGHPEPEEALGYLAWQSQDAAAARQHFAQAFAAGSKNAQMCFDYAALESQASPPGKDQIAVLQRAVQLKPDYVEARLRLGILLEEQQRYTEALDELHQISKVNPDQATPYFLTLSYLDYRTSRLDEARKNAELAKKWAKTPAESTQAESLIRAVAASQSASTQSATAATRSEFQPGANHDGPPTLQYRPAPPSEVRETAPPRNPFVEPGDQMNHVEGVAQRLDCSGKSALFHVRVGKTAMAFEIEDPAKVVIKHSNQSEADFTCGAQKPFPVAVDYAVKPDAAKGTAGIVRELDF